MIVYIRTRAKAQPLAEKGSAAGMPATEAVGAGHTTLDLAARRVS